MIPTRKNITCVNNRVDPLLRSQSWRIIVSNFLSSSEMLWFLLMFSARILQFACMSLALVIATIYEKIPTTKDRTKAAVAEKQMMRCQQVRPSDASVSVRATVTIARMAAVAVNNTELR